MYEIEAHIGQRRKVTRVSNDGSEMIRGNCKFRPVHNRYVISARAKQISHQLPIFRLTAKIKNSADSLALQNLVDQIYK